MAYRTMCTYGHSAVTRRQEVRHGQLIRSRRPSAPRHRPCPLTERTGGRCPPRASPGHGPARRPRPALPGPRRTRRGDGSGNVQRAVRHGPFGCAAHRRRRPRRASPPGARVPAQGPYPQRLGSAPGDRARTDRVERAVLLRGHPPCPRGGGHPGSGHHPRRRRPDTRRRHVPAPRRADAGAAARAAPAAAGRGPGPGGQGVPDAG